MNRPQTIAGVVLTLNEERNLPRALKSLSWCDELLVVDSGSTDRTQQVATQNGARFIQNLQPAPFQITEQRNWTLHSAGLTSDWVLFIDADEEVRPRLAAKITDLIYPTNPTAAYELAPRYWFLGKWLKYTQSYPNWHPRLLRRNSIYFQGGVWESFSDPSVVDRIAEPYEHYAFSKGIDDWIATHLRYAEEEANQTLKILYSKESDLPTIRRKTYRIIAARLWPIRPFLRFFQKYILQLGFLEGWQSFLYCNLIFCYELFVVVKLIQSFRLKRGLSL